jgi:hypothetical protein
MTAFELPPVPDVVHHHFLFPAETGPVVAEKRLKYRAYGWRVSEIVVTEHRCGAVEVKVGGYRLTKKGTIDRRCLGTLVQDQEFAAEVARSWAARTVTQPAHLISSARASWP